MIYRQIKLLFIAGLFVWFAAQAIYFSVHVKLGCPPDENYHFQLSNEYKELKGIFI